MTASPDDKFPPIPAHPLYEPIAEETVWQQRFALQRVRFRYRRFDGSLSGELVWELWRRGLGVTILPYDPWTDRVALIEQFRLPALSAGLDPILIECPAGLRERHEAAETAALRETMEETGLEPDRLEPIGDFMIMHGGCDELVNFFAARVRLPEPQQAQEQGHALGLASEDEDTRLLVAPAEEAFAWVAQNRIKNAPAALSLLWLQVNRARLRREWSA